MKPSEIVPMAEAHVAAVAELEKACFSAPWSEASVREELTNPLSLWLVSLVDGQVAGYVGSQTVLDDAAAFLRRYDENFFACHSQTIGKLDCDAGLSNTTFQ